MNQNTIYFSGVSVRLMLSYNRYRLNLYEELDAYSIYWQESTPVTPVYMPDSAYLYTLMNSNILIAGAFSLNINQEDGLFVLARKLQVDRIEDVLAFDLAIEFLDSHDTDSPRIQWLRDVFITGVSHSESPSGEPVRENYEFIARSIQA